jgi:hypothetical protein
LTSSGKRFHFSTVRTAKEYFLGSVLAYWTLSPCPPAACKILTHFGPVGKSKTTFKGFFLKF